MKKILAALRFLSLVGLTLTLINTGPSRAATSFRLSFQPSTSGEDPDLDAELIRKARLEQWIDRTSPGTSVGSEDDCKYESDPDPAPTYESRLDV